MSNPDDGSSNSSIRRVSIKPSGTTAPRTFTLLLCMDLVELSSSLRYRKRCILLQIPLKDIDYLKDGMLFEEIRKRYNEQAGFWRWKRVLSIHGVARIDLVKVELVNLRKT